MFNCACKQTKKKNNLLIIEYEQLLHSKVYITHRMSLKKNTNILYYELLLKA
jgi:hypothetical protein